MQLPAARYRLCQSRVYTDLAVIDITPAGMTVVDMCEGMDFSQLQALTAVPLRVE